MYFWNDIKKNYINNRDSFSNEKTNRSIFYKDILLKNKLIILCFEDTNFRLRSGTNFELFAFEQFINDLTLANNLAQKLSTPSFEISTTEDIITVQISSLVKNMVAIKSGILEASGAGENARAWLDLGTATMSLGDKTNGDIYYQKALKLDPNILKQNK